MPSPSVSSGVLEPFRVKNPRKPTEFEPDPVLDTAAEILDAMKTTLQNIRERTIAITGNPMLPEVAKQRQARQSGFASLATQTTRLDGLVRAVTTELAEIDGKMLPPKPKDNVVDALLGTEIRQFLRGLNEDARRRVIAKGDDKIIAAIAHTPSDLCGLTDAMLNGYLHQWKVQRFPALVERRRRLEGALEVVERTGGIANSYVAGLTDAEAIQRAEIAEARAREAA